jgi:hypothetical protein
VDPEVFSIWKVPVTKKKKRFLPGTQKRFLIIFCFSRSPCAYIHEQDEAFALWSSEWSDLYPHDSESYKAIEEVANTFYLVSSGKEAGDMKRGEQEEGGGTRGGTGGGTGDPEKKSSTTLISFR